LRLPFIKSGKFLLAAHRVNLPRGFLSFSSYPIHKAGDIEKEMARTISFLLAGAKKKRKRERERFSLVGGRIHLLI